MSIETTGTVSAGRIKRPGLTFGPFGFDPNSRILRRATEEIPLPPRVIGVLELLLERAGDVVSRQELIDRVWKDAFVTDTSLAEAVSYLRQALGDDPQAPTYVQTVHRRGYRFVAPVAEQATPPAVQVTSAAPATAEQAGPPAATVEPPLRPSIGRELVPWSVAIICLAMAASALWYATRRATLEPPIVKVPITLAQGYQFDRRAAAIAISPSGRRVAWSACRGGCRLFVRELHSLEAREIPQTEGAAAPFFSPDDNWIGFYADGKLKKAFLRGGAPALITDASQPLGAVWMPDGWIVFADSVAGGLSRVRAEGGPASTLTTPDVARSEVRHTRPSMASDGQGLFFIVETNNPTAAGRLAYVPYRNGTLRAPARVVLTTADSGGQLGEFLVFSAGREVQAVAFDPVRLATSGIAQAVDDWIAAGQFALSAGGDYAAVDIRPVESLDPMPSLEWVLGKGPDPRGDIEQLAHVTLSPDGTRAAGRALDGSGLWVVDVDGGPRTRAVDSGEADAPVWHPSGHEILYMAPGASGSEIRAQAIGGAGRVLLAREGRHVAPGSSGGDLLAYTESGGATGSDVGLLRLSGGNERKLVASTSADELAPALNREGTLLAYQTDESSRWEIALLNVASGNRVIVSNCGATAPRWAPDGTLFFSCGDRLMRLPVTTAGEVSGPPVAAAQGTAARVAGFSPSGAVLLQRPYDPGRESRDSAAVTLQWLSFLRRTLLPPTAASPR